MSQAQAQVEVTRICRNIDALGANANAAVLSVWQYKLRCAQQYLGK